MERKSFLRKLAVIVPAVGTVAAVDMINSPAEEVTEKERDISIGKWDIKSDGENLLFIKQGQTHPTMVLGETDSIFNTEKDI